MRLARPVILMAGSVMLFGSIGGCDPAPTAEREYEARSPERNVLLLSVDTWRGDHLAGDKAGVQLMPRIAQIAEHAMVFTEASSAGNATAAGVTGLLTGLLPRRAGVVRNAHRLQPEVPTLATTLHAQGFETAALVANPVLASEHGFAEGFDRYELLSRTRRQTGGYADALTEQAIAWIADRQPDGRFLLWVHYMDPHGPYEPPAAYRSLFDAEKFEGPPRVPFLPAGDQTGLGGIPRYQQVKYAGKRPSHDAREYAARYAAEVRFIDDAIGSLLETMEARGWLDDTIVVLTSDHGEALAGEHGYWFSHGHGLTRDQVHVPLLLRCGSCGEGARIDRPVSTIDVVPTVLELLDISAPLPLDGSSLLRERPGVVISQSADGTTARTGQWKLTQGPDSPPRLIDLQHDATESLNVAGQHPEQVRALRAQLRAATRAPLTQPVQRDALGPDELESLRALGYVE